MAEIEWNSVGKRIFEVGLDRGVLYIPDQEIAVPWNGLTNVDDVPDSTIEPLYFNGVKYHDYISRGDYKGTLSAFTYPEEFELFDGVFESPANGIYITGQIPTNTFHLSYRTMIGNDIEGQNLGYKIHILYNLTAKPSAKAYGTLGPTAAAAYEFSWELSSVPVAAFNLRPTSHIIFDTTKMHELAIYEIERTIYGTDETPPQILSIDEFEEMTQFVADIQITDNLDGSWNAAGSDYYIKLNRASQEFAIHEANAVYLDSQTYEITSTEGIDVPEIPSAAPAPETE